MEAEEAVADENGPRLGQWIHDAADALLLLERAVPLFELVKDLDAMDRLSLPDLGRLCSALRAQGYLLRAETVANVLDARKAERGGPAVALRAELAVLTGQVELHPAPLAQPYEPRSGRILAVVDASLPDVDSSSARSAHRFAQQTRRLGLEVAIATEMGFAGRGGYDVDELDGVSYHRIPGPARGTIPLDDWLKLSATRLSAVVRQFRPAAIVASSDFVAGLAAHAVCADYQLPFVYDVSSQAADSWLSSRPEEPSTIEQGASPRWGVPDSWTLRRQRELALIHDADAAVVNSRQFQQAMVALGADGDRIVEVGGGAEIDADRWLALAERLGVIEPGSAEIRTAVSRPIELGEVRRLIGHGQRAPLDRVTQFGGGVATVESIREEGWRLGDLDPVEITSPFDWVASCRENRSQGFHLHAWDFMVPFLKRWGRTRDPHSLVWCLERAVDWSAMFNEGDDRGTMAWYDMAIGLRMPRLAYLLREAVHENAPDDIVGPLVGAVRRHQQEVFAASAFNARTNHGFYTAVGQLSFARQLSPLPAMSAVKRQGEQRLRTVAASQFGSDGGHLEHSPDYHRMLLSSFRDAMDDGLLTDPEVSERLTRAGEVMGWFIQPDRRMVQIGDSPARLVSPEDRALQTPHSQFLASGGRSGVPNDQELLVLPDSGYAIVRSPQPKSRDDHLEASYLTFMGGFHSRAHKHCDDLSLTWFDRGQELLIDSGRFGYLDLLPTDSPERKKGFFYGRPERQYVEGVKAHNTAAMDDLDHDRRDRAPYGSGIVSADELHGHFRMVGSVEHGNWSHQRMVTLLPGSWLLVEDHVRSANQDNHEFKVWWNLADGLTDPEVDGTDVVFTLTTPGRRLYVVSLSGDEVILPVKGQKDPLRGWRAEVDYEFTPTWSMAHRVHDTSEHTFVTLFMLDERPHDRPPSPFEE